MKKPSACFYLNNKKYYMFETGYCYVMYEKNGILISKRISTQRWESARAERYDY